MPGPDNMIPPPQETVEERHARLQAEAEVKAATAELRLLTSARLQPVDPEFDPTESRHKATEIISHLYPDEPVIVFRAKDILSTFALDEYTRIVEKFAPDSPQLVSLIDVLIEFRYWQRANPDKIKLPD